MIDTPDNDAVDAIKLPHYGEAMRELQKVHAWALAGFPGATFADLARIASNEQPERQLRAIRRRGERKVRTWQRSLQTK